MSKSYVVVYGPDPEHLHGAGPFTSVAAAHRAFVDLADTGRDAAYCTVIDVESWRDVKQFFGLVGRTA